uniref:Uncharacterized protein n=1 Tax=Panax quinquefolius TaxID=44588 RepID=A9QMA4_PANQU|nr:hypothetical protein LBL2 [Panax quinquefolius]
MVLEHQSCIEGGYYSTPHHPVVPPTGAANYAAAAAHPQSSYGFAAGYPHPQAHYDYNPGSPYYGAVQHGVAYTEEYGCPFTALMAGCWLRN